MCLSSASSSTIIHKTSAFHIFFSYILQLRTSLKLGHANTGINLLTTMSNDLLYGLFSHNGFPHECNPTTKSSNKVKNLYKRSVEFFCYPICWVTMRIRFIDQVCANIQECDAQNTLREDANIQQLKQ